MSKLNEGAIKLEGKNTKAKDIFAVSAGMDAAGRFKSSLFVDPDNGGEVRIVNSDYTVQMRFSPEWQGSPLSHAVAFRSSDFEAGDDWVFWEEDGRMVFGKKLSTTGEVHMKKTCGTPDITLEDVKRSWDAFPDLSDGAAAQFVLSPRIFRHLHDGLSHVEFSGKDGKLFIVQRDIYSGMLLEIEYDPKALSNPDFSTAKVFGDFGPFGVRYTDLQALFAFQKDGIKMIFHADHPGFFFASGAWCNMSAVVACCQYDELGFIGTSTDPLTYSLNLEQQEQQEAEDGRKEQEKRRCVEGTGGQNQKGRAVGGRKR